MTKKTLSTKKAPAAKVAEKSSALAKALLAPKKDRISKKKVPAAVIAKFGPEAEPAAEKPSHQLRIKCTLEVAGLIVDIDASDLARTLGSGAYGYGQGLVDKWSDAVWIGLLKSEGLPTEPFDRTNAEKPVKRLVQRLWYEAIQPSVLQRSVFTQRDEMAVEEYKAKASEVKEAKVVAAKRREHMPLFGRIGKTYYEPTAELKKSKGAGLGGQQVFLAKAFKAAKWERLTTQEATDGMVKAGLQTTTKPERIAGFYLAQWCKKGLLIRGA